MPNRTRCYAARCMATTTFGKLMCLRHWNLVPHELQRDVYAAHRRMQKEEPGSLRAWVLAASHAQLAVAEREGLNDVAAEIRPRVEQMEKGQL